MPPAAKLLNLKRLVAGSAVANNILFPLHLIGRLHRLNIANKQPSVITVQSHVWNMLHC